MLLYVVVGLLMILLLVVLLNGVEKTAHNTKEIFAGRQKPRWIFAGVVVILLVAAFA